jgi:hypothetical protein
LKSGRLPCRAVPVKASFSQQLRAFTPNGLVASGQPTVQ